MTTTTYINVTLPEPVDAGRLEAWFRAYWTRNADYDLDDAVGGWDGDLTADETSLSLWCNTKYQIAGAEEAAKGLSTKYPTATVEYIEEWDDEGSGRERRIIQNGRLTVAQEAALVPTNLADLIGDVKGAIAALDRAAEGDSNDDEIEAGQVVATLASALINALEA